MDEKLYEIAGTQFTESEIINRYGDEKFRKGLAKGIIKEVRAEKPKSAAMMYDISGVKFSEQEAIDRYGEDKFRRGLEKGVIKPIEEDQKDAAMVRPSAPTQEEPAQKKSPDLFGGESDSGRQSILQTDGTGPRADKAAPEKIGVTGLQEVAMLGRQMAQKDIEKKEFAEKQFSSIYESKKSELPEQFIDKRFSPEIEVKTLDARITRLKKSLEDYNNSPESRAVGLSQREANRNVIRREIRVAEEQKDKLLIDNSDIYRRMSGNKYFVDGKEVPFSEAFRYLTSPESISSMRKDLEAGKTPNVRSDGDDDFNSMVKDQLEAIQRGRVDRFVPEIRAIVSGSILKAGGLILDLERSAAVSFNEGVLGMSSDEALRTAYGEKTYNELKRDYDASEQKKSGMSMLEYFDIRSKEKREESAIAMAGVTPIIEGDIIDMLQQGEFDLASREIASMTGSSIGYMLLSASGAPGSAAIFGSIAPYEYASARMAGVNKGRAFVGSVTNATIEMADNLISVAFAKQALNGAKRMAISTGTKAGLTGSALRDFTSKAVTTTAEGIIKEAPTEFLQEGGNETVRQLTYDEDIDFDRIMRNGAIGSIAATPTAGAFTLPANLKVLSTTFKEWREGGRRVNAVMDLLTEAEMPENRSVAKELREEAINIIEAEADFLSKRTEAVKSATPEQQEQLKILTLEEESIAKSLSSPFISDKTREFLEGRQEEVENQKSGLLQEIERQAIALQEEQKRQAEKAAEAAKRQADGAVEVVIDKPTIVANSKPEVDNITSASRETETGQTFNSDGTVYSDGGLVIPIVSENLTQEELTPERIAEFAERHKNKIGSNDVKVGIYKFPDSNQVSIDLNIVVPRSSRDVGVDFGRIAGQESLFDLDTFENVKTGADGSNPMTFTDEQFKEIARALGEGRMPNLEQQQQQQTDEKAKQEEPMLEGVSDGGDQKEGAQDGAELRTEEATQKEVEAKKADIERERQEELNKPLDRVKSAKTRDELIEAAEEWIGINPYDDGATSMGTRSLLMTPGSFQKGKEAFINENKEASKIRDRQINAEYDAKLKALEQQTEQNKKQSEDEQAKPGNRLFNKPLEGVSKIADRYYERVFGKKRPKYRGSRKLDRARAKRISDAFEAMANNPNDPMVRRAYEAMAKEVIDQYQAFIDAGYKVEINNEEPYGNSAEMIEDLRSRKVIKIFSTESGFGDTPITDQQRQENPLLRDSGFKDMNGQTMLINDLFRAVHDFFGHAELGNSFGPKGEENAWNVHARMFSPLARAAMTTETRGQNSYVNFSGVNERVEAMREEARKLRDAGDSKGAEEIVQKIYEEMSFADQKVGLLPEEFYEVDETDTGDVQTTNQQQDAIQEPKTEEVPLQPEAGGSQEVQQAQQEVGAQEGGPDVQEEVAEEEVKKAPPKIRKAIRNAVSLGKVRAKGVKGLYAIYRKQYAMPAAQAAATALVSDRLITSIAKRIAKKEGIPLKDAVAKAYSRIQFADKRGFNAMGLSERGKALYQVIGPNANLQETVRQNLDVAEQMEAAGKDAKTIRLATGWERGAEGKWRYEIPDNIPFLNDTVNTINEFFSDNVDDGSGILGYKAELILPQELLDLYPQLAEVSIFFDRNISEFNGSYSSSEKSITVGVYNKNAVGIILHEVQHAIQDIEGFARGGSYREFIEQSAEEIYNEDQMEAFNVIQDMFNRNVDPVDILLYRDRLDPKKREAFDYVLDNPQRILSVGESQEKYRKLAGEVEARNVQARMNMTPEQRMATTLRETEDVARDEQIILFNQGAIPEGVRFQVDAWHGSPYQFDKFTTQAIGTGEGAQAFGWGLYFTDLESIAKGYATSLAKQQLSSEDIKKWHEIQNEILPEDFDGDDTSRLYAVDVLTAKLYKQDFVEPYWLKGKKLTEEQKAEVDLIVKKYESKLPIVTKPIVYKVSLHKGKTPDQYTWLEWDKPLTKNQIDKIKKQAGIEGVDISNVDFSGDVKNIYNELGQHWYFNGIKNHPKEVSLFLLRAGIDGIKYPAESISRGATSDTARGFNYVVFDENAVSIEEVIKFQKDAINARGAMMMTMDGRAIIYALTNPNVSTPLHELAHVFEHYLTDQEKDDVLKSYADATGDNSGVWSVGVSEYFARGFEKYLSDGVAPTDALKKIFELFKEWLTDIYNGVTGSDIDVKLNDKMKAIYDSMLTGQAARKSTKAPSTRQVTRQIQKKKIDRDKLKDAFDNYVKQVNQVMANIRAKIDETKKERNERIDQLKKEYKDLQAQMRQAVKDLKDDLKQLAREQKDDKAAVNALAKAVRDRAKSLGLKSTSQKTLYTMIEGFKKVDRNNLNDYIDEVVDQLKAEWISKQMKQADSLWSKVNKKNKRGDYGNLATQVNSLLAIPPGTIPENLIVEYVDLLTRLQKVFSPKLAVNVSEEIGEFFRKNESELDSQAGLLEELKKEFARITSQNQNLTTNKERLDKLKENATTNGISGFGVISEEDFDYIVSVNRKAIINAATVSTPKTKNETAERQNELTKLKAAGRKVDIRKFKDEVLKSYITYVNRATDAEILELTSSEIKALRVMIAHANNGMINKTFIRLAGKLDGIHLGEDMLSSSENINATTAAANQMLSSMDEVRLAREQAKSVADLDATVQKMLNKSANMLGRLVKKMSGSKIYTLAINKYTSARDKVSTDVNKVKTELNDMFYSMSTSFGGPVYNSALLSLYFRVREKALNPNELEIGDPFSYLVETIKDSSTGKSKVEALSVLAEKYFDGYEKLDDNQKLVKLGQIQQEILSEIKSRKGGEIISYMDKIVEQITPKAKFLAEVVTGKPWKQYTGYQPRTTAARSSMNPDEIAAERVKKYTRASTKSKRIDGRQAGDRALTFDAIGDFIDLYEDVNMHYEVSLVMSRIASMVNHVKKKGDKKMKLAADVIERYINQDLSSSIVSDKKRPGFLDRVVSRARKNIVTSILSGYVAKLPADTASMFLKYFLYSPIKYTQNMSALRKVKAQLKGQGYTTKDILSVIGSTHKERAGVYHDEIYQTVSSLVDQVRREGYSKNMFERINQKFAVKVSKSKKLRSFKRGASMFAEAPIRLPDKMTTSVYVAGEFINKFEELSGRKLDANKLMNDANYRAANKRFIDEARGHADKIGSRFGNIGTIAERAISARNTSAIEQIKTFMWSFPANESENFYAALESLWTGEGEFDVGAGKAKTRISGIAYIMSQSVSMVAYQVFRHMIMNAVLNQVMGFIFGTSDSDDDEESKVIKKALYRGFVDMALTNFFGRQKLFARLATMTAVDAAVMLAAELSEDEDTKETLTMISDSIYGLSRFTSPTSMVKQLGGPYGIMFDVAYTMYEYTMDKSEGKKPEIPMTTLAMAAGMMMALPAGQDILSVLRRYEMEKRGKSKKGYVNKASASY